jgi:hypothetical protein
LITLKQFKNVSNPSIIHILNPLIFNVNYCLDKTLDDTLIYHQRKEQQRNLYRFHPNNKLNKRRNIKIDASVTFRIFGIMCGANSIPGVTSSTHDRIFVSFCLIWSLICCGAFQVKRYFFLLSHTLKTKINLTSEKRKENRKRLTSILLRAVEKYKFFFIKKFQKN